MYQGAALGSRQRCYWKVRVWDEKDQGSAWSEMALWEMGLLQTADWQADWISADIEEDISKPEPAPMLRTTFEVKGAVAKARAYIIVAGAITNYT